uniref:Uncharacterized protein n=1 Tax=Anguilla anguilla TaxID=7936 RepID=A0A0E9T6K8_ANGAN
MLRRMNLNTKMVPRIQIQRKVALYFGT